MRFGAAMFRSHRFHPITEPTQLPLRPCVSMALCFATLCTVPLRVLAQTAQPLKYEATGLFTSPGLSESSGVAVSRSQHGVIWTHNDSGDGALIYATNLVGEDLGTFRVLGADAVDWEDIAAGPCPTTVDGSSCLYVADTGDNFETRDHVTIYIFPEPAAGQSSDTARTERAAALRLRYPDRPRDAEALAVTADGDLLIVSKGRTPPATVYSVPGSAIGQPWATATLVDTLPIDLSAGLINQVTAAALSPSGSLLAVRTYTQILFLDPTRGFTLAAPPCQIGLRQPQGEALDFLDERSIVLTSEAALGREGGLARVECPVGAPG